MLDLEHNPHLKEDIFRAPEGYFDNLPYRMQMRIAPLQQRQGFRFQWAVSVLRIALPMVLVMGMVVAGGIGLPSKADPADTLYQALHANIDAYDTRLLMEVAAETLPVAAPAAATQQAQQVEEYILNSIDTQELIDAYTHQN